MRTIALAIRSLGDQTLPAPTALIAASNIGGASLTLTTPRAPAPRQGITYLTRDSGIRTRSAALGHRACSSKSLGRISSTDRDTSARSTSGV